MEEETEQERKFVTPVRGKAVPNVNLLSFPTEKSPISLEKYSQMPTCFCAWNFETRQIKEHVFIMFFFFWSRTCLLQNYFCYYLFIFPATNIRRRKAGAVGGKMGAGFTGEADSQVEGRQMEVEWKLERSTTDCINRSEPPPGMLHCATALLQYWLILLLTVRRLSGDFICLTSPSPFCLYLFLFLPWWQHLGWSVSTVFYHQGCDVTAASFINPFSFLALKDFF